MLLKYASVLMQARWIQPRLRAMLRSIRCMAHVTVLMITVQYLQHNGAPSVSHNNQLAVE